MNRCKSPYILFKFPPFDLLVSTYSLVSYDVCFSVDSKSALSLGYDVNSKCLSESGIVFHPAANFKLSVTVSLRHKQVHRYGAVPSHRYRYHDNYVGIRLSSSAPLYD